MCLGEAICWGDAKGEAIYWREAKGEASCRRDDAKGCWYVGYHTVWFWKREKRTRRTFWDSLSTRVPWRTRLCVWISNFFIQRKVAPAKLPICSATWFEPPVRAVGSGKLLRGIDLIAEVFPLQAWLRHPRRLQVLNSTDRLFHILFDWFSVWPGSFISTSSTSLFDVFLASSSRRVCCYSTARHPATLWVRHACDTIEPPKQLHIISISMNWQAEEQTKTVFNMWNNSLTCKYCNCNALS